ncbi:MAG TPA: nuclear transport factor 2 family protein [Thermoanaerobaculia bacterium]|nr:nuclear transport factor 2 family protein [Thermoanaerobaculia bacterium]
MRVATGLMMMVLLAACASTSVPDTAPAPESEEFQIEATVLAVYNVVSGPAGRRDWKVFEELFAPDARIVTVEGGKTTVLAPHDYAEHFKPILNEKSVFEHPVATRVERDGDVAQVWTAYEARATASQEKFDARGVESFQLVKVNGAWKVQSILRQQQ